MRFDLAAAICIRGALLALILAAPASAGVVYVAVNRATGEVAVAGNRPDALEWLQSKTVASSAEGWGETFGTNEPGWGSVTCARLENGQYYFQVADGHQSEAAARGLAAAAVEQHLSKTGMPGKLIPGCGYSWNNMDQPIMVEPREGNSGVALAKSGGSTSEAAQKTVGSGKLASTPIGPLAQPILVNGDRVLVPQSQPGVPSSGFSNNGQSGAPAPAPKRDYEAEYQEKMRLWKEQQAEQQRRVAEYEEAKRQIELRKATQAEQARTVLGEYERQMAEHARAAAEFAEKQRQWQLVSQQHASQPGAQQTPSAIGEAQLRCRMPEDEHEFYRDCSSDGATGPATATNSNVNDGASREPPPGSGLELHLEAVTVCQFVPPQSQFGNWRCLGPLQINYVNFDKPNWLSALRMVGGSELKEPRDLGLVGGFRVFGWNFPLYKHPDSERDAALKMGVPSIPTRFRYWCPKGKSTGCTKH